MTAAQGPTQTGHTDQTVEGYIATLDDERTVEDTRSLIELMHRISGRDPQLWNVGTIGFDTYHFRYDSGREGDGHGMGFYPRKGKLTVYLLDGTARHADSLASLGKHTTSRVCVYVKRLSDIDLSVLEQILRDSYGYLKDHDGEMHRAV
jgi:hypothetical protein